MASKSKQDLSEYPRPWFYRPEIYYGLIIFPPVWSVLTLRSPWHSGEGFRGILVGGIAWFLIIASIVFAVKWVQPDDDGNSRVVNLFLFVPGILLTVLTQVQWTAHRAQHGPPLTEAEDDTPAPAPVTVEPTDDTFHSGEDADEVDEPASGQPAASDFSSRRRRRRRRRPISRSADSTTLC